MNDDKMKDAPALAQQNAPNQVDSSMSSIAPKPEEVKADSGGKQFHRGKKTKVLQAYAKVNTLALKFYDEQLPRGEAYFLQAIQNTDPKETQIIAIQHTRDIVTDGIWDIAKVKPHWHVILRFTNSKYRMRVLNIMAGLGVVFRPGVDDSLWLAHGVETIGNFAGYALYLTHETPEAIRDGKELYRMDELVSNLTEEQIENVRAGYIRVTDNKKLSQAELIALDREAYDLGHDMGDFAAWYDAQPFIVRSCTKMRTIKESYDRGVEARIAEGQEIQRLCIFILGEPNTGKTYASAQALEGKRILSVKGGGTGKLDRLRPDHDAILIDDDTCPNLLNMTDNYICHAYRRNSNNPAWAGEYFVVTSNVAFPEWLESCGIKARDTTGNYTKHYRAMLSRFYVCELRMKNGVNHLALRSPSTRGTVQEQTERLDKFRAFKGRFDAVIAGYVPGAKSVDYSQDIEP